MLIKNYQAFPEKALKFGVAAMLMAMCLFCSCSELETTSPQDYIGPAKQPAEPNIQPSQDTGKTQESHVPTVAASTTRIEPTGPLSITINEAVLMSLERNKSLVVQKLNPQIKRTVEQQALSVFDPDLTGTVSAGKSRAESMPRPGIGTFPSTSRTFDAEATLSEFFPTGTLLSLDGSTNTLDGSFVQEPFVTSRLGLSVTQSLLRGFGPTVNLIAVNQARIDTRMSQYELRGFVESLVAQVEETYWSYSLAEKSIEIFKQSMRLAEEQQKQTEEQIRVGTLAASELAAARAEVALRRQDLIVAENTLAQTKLYLLRLLNPEGPEMWNREIILQSIPEAPAVEFGPVQSRVEQGLQMRPEINQARLQLDRDELEVIRTRNGLLPQLDFFITLGKTGYADSFDDSTRNIFKKNYDALAGISFEYPPINRSAQAKHQQAILSRQQAQEAIDNLGQLVEVDIRGAYLQITSVQQQVAAARASRELQEEKLKVETEKFNVGKSTSILVAQAQRDFLQSQIAEIQALINYQIAVVELYRLEGTLLLRSGIASPGGVPVKISKTTSN
jgi:outer membrane protein TolC